MTFKTALMSATALTMMAGVAFAQSNESYNVQDGVSNAFTVNQTGALNDVGQSTPPAIGAGGPVSQDGDNNTIYINQYGDRASFGAALPSGVLASGAFTYEGVEQNGTFNRITANQGGIDNRIDEILQSEDGDAGTTAFSNDVTINQSGTRDNLVRQINQTQTLSPGGNVVTINQSGIDGAIGLRNRHGYTGIFQNASNAASNAAIVNQSSIGNSVDIVRQTAGGATASLASNQLTINQSGANNEVSSVLQLANTFLGRDPSNSASINQSGANNLVGFVRQDARGDAQFLTLNFSGSGNGVGTFSGGIASSVDPVGQSNVRQDGQNNIISFSFPGNSNLYSFAQFGNDNMLTGSFTGNANEVAVLQEDGGNATINANGNRNDIGLTQTGGAMNEATIVTNGNRNEIDATQTGSGNELGLYVNGSLNDVIATQEGIDNYVSVAINGSLNELTMSQFGDGNSINGAINGTNNVMNVDQGAIGVPSDGNIVHFNYGSGANNNSHSISQSGAGGNSVALTVNSSNNIGNFTQNGTANSINVIQ